MSDTDEKVAAGRAWRDNHLALYLADGKAGHIIDTRAFGGPKETVSLVLKTIGRKSGKVQMTPLIYIAEGEEYVIVASNAGSETHPAWYFNLVERPEVEFQVVEDKFRGTWRIAEGEERTRLWNAAVNYFSPYSSYRQNTARQIPVVVLTPKEKIGSL